MEYYSAIKNGIMKVTGKVMELEIVILSEVIQTQKDKHKCFSLIVDVDLESSDRCILFGIFIEVKNSVRGYVCGTS